ncbi:MAG: hypothetical protein JXN59_12460, partial [Anaerolineae bacterium]|nr:hypothetical protein [Anaerolineae bacterium]
MRDRINSLWFQLALISLLVTWIAIGVVALSVRNTTEASFRRYVQGQSTQRFGTEIVTTLEAYYATNSSWDGAIDAIPEPGQGAAGQGSSGQGRGSGSGGRGAQLVLANPEGQIVAAADEHLVGEPLSAGARENA